MHVLATFCHKLGLASSRTAGILGGLSLSQVSQNLVHYRGKAPVLSWNVRTPEALGYYGCNTPERVGHQIRANDVQRIATCQDCQEGIPRRNGFEFHLRIPLAPGLKKIQAMEWRRLIFEFHLAIWFDRHG